MSNMKSPKAGKQSPDEAFLLQALGMRVAYLRKRKGMSQLNLSLVARIAKSYLSDLERGKRNPGVIVLTRIAEALQVSLEELFKGIEPLK